MSIPTKTALSAVGVLLAFGGLAGCGGNSGGGGGDKGADAPTSASKSDFCDGFASFTKNTADLNADKDPKSAIKTAKTEVGKLQGTGTPDGISADARTGFEVFVDTVESIPDDASADDLQNYGNNLSSTKQKQLEAFIEYVGTECPEALGGSSDDSASPSASAS